MEYERSRTTTTSNFCAVLSHPPHALPWALTLMLPMPKIFPKNVGTWAEAWRWIGHGPLAPQAAVLELHCCGFVGSNWQVVRLSTDGSALLPFCFQFAFRNDCASTLA